MVSLSTFPSFLRNARTIFASVCEEEFDEFFRVVEFGAVVAAFVRKKFQKNNVNLASKGFVAAAEFGGVRTGCSERVVVAVKLEDFHSCLGKRREIVDGVEFGDAAFEFLERYAVAKVFGLQRDDARQTR